MTHELTNLTLVDLQSGAVATIVPARGGSVTSFEVAGQRILFLDPATLRDPTKNLRGGVPVLFPSPGKLVADMWSYGERRGSMKQHGFARKLPWQVASASPSAATLTLAASDATRAEFPWDFIVELSFKVTGRSLRIDHRVTNRGDSAMPFGFGFHPYFFVPDAAKHATTIATRATKAFDNVTKQTIELSVIDLARQEVDLHLLDHGSATIELVSPAGAVQLRGSSEYTHWVVWTLAGQDFICLEPWTCPGNALNTGDRLLVLEPAQSRSLSLEITA